MNKYPNANTSPERLAEIKGHLENYAFAEPDAHESIRDLLAMLQERTASLEFYMKQYAAAVKAADVFQCGGPLDNLLTLGQSTLIDGPLAAVKEIERLRQQLHDQRWRRFSANAQPEINQPVEFIGADPEVVIPVRRFPDGSYVISGSDGLDCIRPHGDDWWRPIPPLPKE